MEQFEFHPATQNRAFQPLDGPSITQLTLNAEPAPSSRRTTLQRWEPGAANSQSHAFVHDFVEEIYLVEGDLTDTRTGEKYEKGWYAYRKPGMEHGPFKSDGGCLMFVVCLGVDEQGEEKKEAVWLGNAFGQR